ncbi:MAG: hypothetical protein U0270_24195 [Labilithrix sp.]
MRWQTLMMPLGATVLSVGACSSFGASEGTAPAMDASAGAPESGGDDAGAGRDSGATSGENLVPSGDFELVAPGAPGCGASWETYQSSLEGAQGSRRGEGTCLVCGQAPSPPDGLFSAVGPKVAEATPGAVYTASAWVQRRAERDLKVTLVLRVWDGESRAPDGPTRETEITLQDDTWTRLETKVILPTDGSIRAKDFVDIYVLGDPSGGPGSPPCFALDDVEVHRSN